MLSHLVKFEEVGPKPLLTHQSIIPLSSLPLQGLDQGKMSETQVCKTEKKPNWLLRTYQSVRNRFKKKIPLDQGSNEQSDKEPTRPNVFKATTNKIVNFFKRFRRKQEEFVKIPEPVSITEQVKLKNDHVSTDVHDLGLTQEQIEQLEYAYDSVKVDKELMWKAEVTNFTVNSHLAYRYYASVDWKDNYNERTIDKAMIETINWRYDYGIHNISLNQIKSLVGSGVSYTSNNMDKQDRPLLYIKLGKEHKAEDAETYLKLLMYTVERADHLCRESGAGEFVAILDMKDFTWSKCPPLSFLQQAIGLLKKHYPYRLAGILIVNASPIFNAIWRLLKPFIPKKALLKTHVITAKNIEILDEMVGLENMEIAYGGQQTESITDVSNYFQRCYWIGNKI